MFLGDHSRVSAHATFWRNLAADASVGAAFAMFGVVQFEGSALHAMAIVTFAIIAWPLIEYVVHRWLMHGPIAATSREHLVHHARPDITFTTPLMAHVYVSLPWWIVLSLITSMATAALLMSGVYAGYVWFRLVHRVVHFHPHVRWFGHSLRVHEAHHARPDHLYGVTTSLWDRVFGTF